MNHTSDGDGDCYAVAGRDILFRDDSEGYVLCHGTVTGRGRIQGIRYGHAWIETQDGLCIDKSNGLDAEMPRAAYYALGKVEQVRRYTPSEARRLMVRHKHFGPWIKQPASDPLTALFSARR